MATVPCNTTLTFQQKVIEQQGKAVERIMAITQPYSVKVGNEEILCLPNVNPPYLDSQLLADSIIVSGSEIVLDAFSGTGVVAILIAGKVRRVIAADISQFAVENIKVNISKHKVEERVGVVKCDIFPTIETKFDVITLNPPYTDRYAPTLVHQSVWDEGHCVLLRFFDQVQWHLSENGCIYISWANFADFGFLESCAKRFGFDAQVVAKKDEALDNFMQESAAASRSGNQIVYRIYKLTRR